MAFIVLVAFFAVLGQVASAQGFIEVSWVFRGIDAILFFAGIIVQFNGRQDQVQDFENIKKAAKVENIYSEKASVLTAEFTKHLAEAYPSHEKDVFSKIGPEQVAIYFAKYPELKASETLLELVKNINALQSSVYGQRIEAEELLATTRTRLRDPWLFKFMIPGA